MEIKVREVSGPGQKSVQEVEQQFVEEQETQEAEATQEEVAEEVEETQEEVTEEGLKEDDVLSFIKDNYKKDISSIDDLFAEKQQEELPEDVSAFLK